MRNWRRRNLNTLIGQVAGLDVEDGEVVCCLYVRAEAILRSCGPWGSERNTSGTGMSLAKTSPSAVKDKANLVAATCQDSGRVLAVSGQLSCIQMPRKRPIGFRFLRANAVV